ncbi:MAG: hypothetical protein JNM88_15825 [Chitinophagaceae bacterium]|nr:hypothetical protein [Chitinophagaceae bacterium]
MPIVPLVGQRPDTKTPPNGEALGGSGKYTKTTPAPLFGSYAQLGKTKTAEFIQQ